MKHFTLLLIACLLSLPTLQAQRKAAPVKLPRTMLSQLRGSKAQMRAHLSLMRREAMWPKNLTPKMWQVAHEQEFEYDGEEWLPSYEYFYTYGENGYMSSTTMGEEGAWERTDYVRDSIGRWTKRTKSFSEDGETFFNDVMAERIYEPGYTELIASHTEYKWDDVESAWATGDNCYRRIVERNADGNVTRIAVELLFGGEYTPNIRTTYIYKKGEKQPMAAYQEQPAIDKDGNVVRVVADSMVNMVWNRCNGVMPESLSDCYLGNNRLASATLMKNNKEIGYIYADYDDKGGFDRLMCLFSDATLVRTIYTVLDDLGSYSVENITATDKNGNGRIDVGEVIDQYKQDVYFNEHGKEISSGYYEPNADGTYGKADGIRTTYTYDEEKGCYKEMLIEMWMGYKASNGHYTGTFEPMIKIVADEFVETNIPTGIKSVSGNASLNLTRQGNTIAVRHSGTASYTLYDAAGRIVKKGTTSGNAEISLNNLPAGTYLFKATSSQGEQTIKVLR